MDLEKVNEERYPKNIQMHGDKTKEWYFNASSYLSKINNNRLTSRTLVRNSFNYEKLQSYLMNTLGMSIIVRSEIDFFDSTLDKRSILKSLTKKNDKKSNHAFFAKKFISYINKENDILITLDIEAELDDVSENIVKDVIEVEICYMDAEKKSYIDSIVYEMTKVAHIQRFDAIIDLPNVGIVCATENGMTVRRFDIQKNVKQMTDMDMDMHYGEDFSVFHKSVVDLLKSDDNGLIILHGTPGTGKTQYVRFLISELVHENKSIIYIPSNFVEMFMDPSFIGFLEQWILGQNSKVVLLLEDAESLIESRDSGIRSQGMSNLLNVTDGILNDILGTQIIITFNTTLDMIDPALLRPGRLLARKEFTELDYEQASKLLEYLQIEDLPVADKMTIAEIYSHKNKRKTIEHNIKEKKFKLGF